MQGAALSKTAENNTFVQRTGATITISNLRRKKDYAYTIIDVANPPSDSIVEKIKAVDGVLKVRVIL